MKKLIEKINQEGYTFVGIRHLSNDESYKVGDFCRNSYDWDYENDRSSYDSEDPIELPGACAYNTGINSGWDEDDEIEEKILKAISESSCYYGKIAVIAGDYACYGNDQEEIIIRDAEVIYLVA